VGDERVGQMEKAAPTTPTSEWKTDG